MLSRTSDKLLGDRSPSPLGLRPWALFKVRGTLDTKIRPKSTRRLFHTLTIGSRHSAKGGHGFRHSARGQFNMFPSISRLFLRCTDGEVDGQTGWGHRRISLWIRHCIHCYDEHYKIITTPIN